MGVKSLNCRRLSMINYQNLNPDHEVKSHMINMNQLEATIKVRRSVLTNQRQQSSQMININLSEVIILITRTLLIYQQLGHMTHMIIICIV